MYEPKKTYYALAILLFQYTCRWESDLDSANFCQGNSQLRVRELDKMAAGQLRHVLLPGFMAFKTALLAFSTVS